jgi:nitroimidazol reductase NimA-like FMN-containing flavoprotein (pyridoxamine 5'-phosphate oxidase superfamily)
MRRQEREIRDEAEIQEILEKGLVCRLGLYDGQYPYVVPLNYGYRNGCMYFHCAREGRKIDILKKNGRVCIEVDIDSRVVRGETPCRWTAKYRSVIGFGRARIIDDEREKKAGLDVIMAHYGGSGGDYDEKSLQRTSLIEVVLESITGKQSLQSIP